LPLTLRLTASNDGNTPLQFKYGAPMRGFGITIQDGAGEFVRRSAWGHLQLADKDAVMRYRFVTEVLGPRGSVQEVINVARYFDLSVPGTYSLSVTWNVESTEVNEGPRLSVEDVKFVVAERGSH
jgi:hypothetical protein